jgi:hypothetical protein
MVETNEGKVSKEEILQLLKESGYPLEQEVASCLEKIEWSPTLNYAFTDVETDNSREIDVLAERAFWELRHIKAQNQKKEQQSKKKWETIEQKIRVNVELLIECKKTKSPIVFFCRPKQSMDFFPTHADNIIQYSGVRPEVTVKPWNELSTHCYSIGQFLNFGQISHYFKCKDKATQFCKIHREGKNFRADHGEVYQSFVVPLIKAVECQKMLHPYTAKTYADMFLYYPILVEEGEIFKVNPECDTLTETNHVELSRYYYSNKIAGRYRIDVVRKDYLCNFIEKTLTPSIVLIDEEVGKKEKYVAKGKMRINSIDELNRDKL